ncbi:MAG: NTP transferase domain-containing protein [Rectinemataceae bacterium]|nr:NTP transferase domain-containing protein [Rectinemataceae bacterium]
MKVAILAAGLGSRFGGIKQLAPIGPTGETLLEYNIYNALKAGFDSIVFLIRKDIEDDFTTHILSRLPGNLPFELAFQDVGMAVPEAFRADASVKERSKPWGTGHALLCARHLLDKAPFAVMNADDFYGAGGLRATHDFLAADNRADGKSGEMARFCLPGYRLGAVVSTKGSVSRAICSTDASGKLFRIVEHTRVEVMEGKILSIKGDGEAEELSPDMSVSMNLWGLTPAVFPSAAAQFAEFLAVQGESNRADRAKAEFYLPGIVGTMITAEEAQVWALPVNEAYFGLTNPDDILEARRAIGERIGRGEYPSPLWSGYKNTGGS